MKTIYSRVHRKHIQYTYNIHIHKSNFHIIIKKKNDDYLKHMKMQLETVEATSSTSTQTTSMETTKKQTTFTTVASTFGETETPGIEATTLLTTLEASTTAEPSFTFETTTEFYSSFKSTTLGPTSATTAVSTTSTEPSERSTTPETEPSTIETTDTSTTEVSTIQSTTEHSTPTETQPITSVSISVSSTVEMKTSTTTQELASTETQPQTTTEATESSEEITNGAVSLSSTRFIELSTTDGIKSTTTNKNIDSTTIVFETSSAPTDDSVFEVDFCCTGFDSRENTTWMTEPGQCQSRNCPAGLQYLLCD